jgi:hypothetical protein
LININKSNNAKKHNANTYKRVSANKINHWPTVKSIIIKLNTKNDKQKEPVEIALKRNLP